jgi:hypothetical protein
LVTCLVVRNGCLVFEKQSVNPSNLLASHFGTCRILSAYGANLTRFAVMVCLTEREQLPSSSNEFHS